MLSWVTDGGLETDLLYHRGIDLPEFASFPLVEDDRARVLVDYYSDYVQVAVDMGAGLVLETPTWRANRDWAARLGPDHRTRRGPRSTGAVPSGRAVAGRRR